jgi:diguanylate cyclase (GGDEF)-like protein
MKKETEKKLHALDPRFRKRFKELMSMMDESVSLLYEAATHDEKTGLYNNKFLENMLDMEIEKAKRAQENLSLFMIDIDFFKKINDKYGHMKADELLERLAKVLMKQIRKSDIAARFGGEEFLVLLPETDLNKAKKLTARLKTAIKSDSMLKKYNLTVSGGITQYKKGDTKKRLKERVDKALYQAKKQGRNRFILVE